MTALTPVDFPTILTDRLVLRAPRLEDFEHWAPFFASERSRFERGPMGREEGYRTWAADVALWQLRGYGPFGCDERKTGTYVGEVGIYQPDGYPGPELGWFVTREAEGKSYAYEAARGVLNWVRDRFDWPFVTNIIDPRNARSIALGQRLGGVIDPSLPGTDPGDVVIRHDLRVAA